jgi:pyruvate kinase
VAETGVGEYSVEAVRAVAEAAEVAGEMPDIRGRVRGIHLQTSSATVLRAAAWLAAELAAAALAIPAATGGAPRACAKHQHPTDRPAAEQPRAPPSAHVGVVRLSDDDADDGFG